MNINNIKNFKQNPEEPTYKCDKCTLFPVDPDWHVIADICWRLTPGTFLKTPPISLTTNTYIAHR